MAQQKIIDFGELMASVVISSQSGVIKWLCQTLPATFKSEMV